MEIKEMIKKYDIFQESKYEPGKGMIYGDKIGVRGVKQAQKDGALDEIKAKKAEIIKYFESERAEARRKYEERQQKIAAIEGLKEIKAAYEDLAKWRHEFNKSFDGEYAVGGLGVRQKPQYDFESMRAQYPVADAFLKAEAYADKENHELSSIGKDALEKIINDSENYAEHIAEMERKLKEFTDRHIWD